VSPEATGSPSVEELFRLAREGVESGRMTDAEWALREAFEATGGTRTPEEARACGNLASLVGILGRRHEALMLYRHALAIHEELGDRRLVIMHVANMCAVYVTLNVWGYVRDTLAELDASVADDPELVQEARYRTVWPRAQLALEDGDTKRARALHTELQAAYAGSPEPNLTITLAQFECDLLLQEGKPKEALAVLDSARFDWEGAQPHELDFLARRLECLQALGRTEEHFELAHEVPSRLDKLTRGDHANDFFVEAANRLAPHLAIYTDLRGEAYAIYDVAAGVVIECLRDLSRSRDALPDSVEATPEDLELLRHLNHAHERRRREFGDAVARLIRRAPRSIAKFLFEEGEDARMVVCAWCGRIRATTGSWLPLPLSLEDPGELLTTHGICPDCYAGERHGEDPSDDEA
jgi:hypothetical protein